MVDNIQIKEQKDYWEANVNLSKVREDVMLRRKLSYKCSDFLCSFNCLLNCRQPTVSKFRAIDRRHLFATAEHKLTQEMDCVAIVQAIRQLRLVTARILEKQELSLAKFQKESLVTEATSRI